MKKINNKKGFSLGELLVVVAIICILFGVVAVNVIQYRKKMRQLAYDSNAQIIFEAAQNRLTELYAAEGERVLDKHSITVRSVTSSYSTDLSCIDDTDTLSAAFLFPDRSLSEEIKAKHWRVEFDKDTGIVYAAFYSVKANGSGNTLYDDAARNKDSSGYRHDAEVGYYGYGDAAITKDYSKMQDYSLKMNIINKDVLHAQVEIKVPSSTAGTVLHLAVTGEQSGHTQILTMNVEDTASLPANVTVTTSGTVIICDVILDKLASGMHFKDLFTGFMPGENILVSAYASFGTANVEDTAPATARTNSLFSDYDAANSTTYIRYGRHLQNLDCDISGVGGNATSGVPVVNVIEEKSIDFTRTGTDLWATEYALTTPVSASVNPWLNQHAYQAFVPIFNPGITGTFTASTSNTDGCTITGLIAAGANNTAFSGNGGVFDTFYGTGVSGIDFSGAYVKATGNAGAFAGATTKAVTFTNVTTYLLYPDYSLEKSANVGITANDLQWITGTGGNAGGLVGNASAGLTFTGCSASSVINAPAGVAGGLFGSTSGTATITNSYADSYVFGGTATGGLGGGAAGVAINSSYAAGFLYKPQGTGTTGHFGYYVPGFTDSGITSSYSIFDSSLGSVSGTTDTIAAVNYVELVGASGSRFVNPANPTELTTPYNISPKGDKFVTYEYPMLYETGSSSVIMHHYGDWNGIKGYHINFHTVGLDAAGNPAVVETFTVTVPYEEKKAFRDVAIGADKFNIYNNAGGNIQLLLKDNQNTGWYVYDETLSCQNPLSSEQITKQIGEDMDVYAKWQCKVEYSSAIGDFYTGGEALVIPADPVLVDYGTKFSTIAGKPGQGSFGVAESIATIEKEDGSVKWYKSYESDYIYGDAFAAEDQITANTVAYARWQCTVNFSSAVDFTLVGGPDVVETEQVVYYGTKFADITPKPVQYSEDSLTVSFGVPLDLVTIEKRDGVTKWYKNFTAETCQYSDEWDVGDRIKKNDEIAYAGWICEVTFRNPVGEINAADIVTQEVMIGTSFSDVVALANVKAEDLGNDSLITKKIEETGDDETYLDITGDWYKAYNPTNYQYSDELLDDTKIMSNTIANAKWKIFVTYRTADKNEIQNGVTAVTVKGGYVDYGTAFSEITKPAAGDFGQTPFALDSSWYTSSALSSAIGGTARITKNLYEIYAKFNGVVLHSEAYSQPVKYAPVSMNTLISTAYVAPTISNTSSSYYGGVFFGWCDKAKDCLINASGIVSVNLTSYLQGGSSVGGGIIHLYGRWLVLGSDLTNDDQGFGRTENSSLEVGTYVIAAIGKGTGGKGGTSSPALAVSGSSLINDKVEVYSNIGSINGGVFIKIGQNGGKVTKDINTNSIWQVQDVNGKKTLMNMSTGQYLGVDSNNQLVMLDTEYCWDASVISVSGNNAGATYLSTGENPNKLYLTLTNSGPKISATAGELYFFAITSNDLIKYEEK